MLNLLKGLRLKGASKLVPFAGVVYGLAIAAAKLSGQDQLADLLERIGPVLGLESPFPLGTLLVLLTSGYGVVRFLASAVKRSQIERPIDQIVTSPGGRDYFFEILHVLQADHGLPADKAFRRARELVLQADASDTGLAAVVALLRQNKP